MDEDAAVGADVARLVRRLRVQASTAGQLGSPLYAELSARIADDVAAGGPCARVLRPFAHEPDSAAVPLRFLAAVHRLVLRGQAPALAAHYPSVGGRAGVEGSWPAFRATVEANVEQLIVLTALPCQTNEVGRSAAIAPGLLWAQARYDLPLHHLEIGTSAGLNLRWDHFRYGTADGSVTWGPADSPVDLGGHWVVAPTELPARADVITRRGCDPTPGDPTDPATRETLTASVWADQRERHTRLQGALELAARIPAQLFAQGAGPWLQQQLADRPDGALTVVTHSVVWRYLPPAEKEQVTDTLAQHGASASPSNPLVWLRLEPAPPQVTYDGHPYPLTATTWPGGNTVVLAHAHAHGQDLRWSGA